MKQALVEEVKRQADWRTQKAAEYPDDAERNLGASDDLMALAKSLDKLRDDDPLWLAYACAVEGGDPFRIAESVSDTLGAVGFRGSAPANGRAFLRVLLQAMVAEAA